MGETHTKEEQEFLTRMQDLLREVEANDQKLRELGAEARDIKRGLAQFDQLDSKIAVHEEDALKDIETAGH